MAYDYSGALPPYSTYSLGNYLFDLNVSYIHEPDEDLVAISAICNGPDGRRESAPVYVSNGVTIESWYVEANSTEASVHARLKSTPEQLDTSPVVQPIPVGGSVLTFDRKPSQHVTFYEKYSGGGKCVYWNGGATFNWIVASDTNGENVLAYLNEYTTSDGRSGSSTLYDSCSRGFTYNGKTVWYDYGGLTSSQTSNLQRSGFINNGAYIGSLSNDVIEKVAWMMVYGTYEDEEEVKLIARFAIDLSEAGGGPDGDWDEPGNTGDPSYTLNVHVTGASSGSNNGTPLEPEQIGGYGNGGTGGNGGGGGAGASTVIIYDFATDKAGTVNQEATAQAPGTGGPGGKGGKGGDGCILIFY